MKLGVMGHGPIVDRFLDAVGKACGAEAIAIYNRPSSETEGHTLAQRHHIKKIYNNFDAFLDEPEIDTVYVALPNSLHYPYALKILLAGKNAIVEKPFTSTVKEAEHLIATAKKNNRFLFEAISTYHAPNIKVIKDYLPLIGDLSLVQTNYSQYSSRYDNLMNGEVTNIFNPEFSGGSLMDINVYNIHFILTLFGVPSSVTYYPRKAENGIDTSGIAILPYPGFVCSAIGAKDSKSDSFAFIQGRNGTIKVEGSVAIARELIISIGDHTQTINLQTKDNHLIYEVEAFAKVMSDSDYSSCYQWLEHTSNVVSALEQARKSAGIIFPADEGLTQI